MQFRGYYFAQLFAKYRVDVHPADLILVSFLEDPQKPGLMTQALTRFGIKPLHQLVLDSHKSVVFFFLSFFLKLLIDLDFWLAFYYFEKQGRTFPSWTRFWGCSLRRRFNSMSHASLSPPLFPIH